MLLRHKSIFEFFTFKMDKNDRALLANLNERVAKGEMLNEQQAKLHERLGEKELILLRAG